MHTNNYIDGRVMSIQDSRYNKKVTVSDIQKLKGSEPIVMVTAYDALFAKLFDGYVEIILVGDSLNMSFLGESDTLSASLSQMIYHTKAVCNGAKNSLVVLDMPFGTYSSPKQALKNSVKVYKECDASAIKVEGGLNIAHIVEHLTKNSIAVMGHIGLMPQFVRSEGGYKVRRNDEDLKELIEDAKALESAGAFAIVVEGVKAEFAKEITRSVNIPTIGIGAGVDTDGQVLVWSDMFGFFEEFKPKFVKHYLDGAKLIRDGIKHYTKDVKNRDFPSDEYNY
jgi:3-methyl-2-oxobutanoate hydroxymethyltransferase